MALAWAVNLRELGNSIALWLSLHPSEIFFYIFLPPLLLDAAVKIDFFLFMKVSLHSLYSGAGVQQGKA